MLNIYPYQGLDNTLQGREYWLYKYLLLEAKQRFLSFCGVSCCSKDNYLLNVIICYRSIAFALCGFLSLSQTLTHISTLLLLQYQNKDLSSWNFFRFTFPTVIWKLGKSDCKSRMSSCKSRLSEKNRLKVSTKTSGWLKLPPGQSWLKQNQLRKGQFKIQPLQG